MEYFAAGLSSLVTIFVLALFVAGVMKLFQIHTVLTEIKDGLRSAPLSGRAAIPYAPSTFSAPPVPEAPATPTALHAMGSGDDMLRALDAQMKWDESASRSESR
jgi:hypothetical protein